MKIIVEATDRYLREAENHVCTKVYKRFKKMAENTPGFNHNRNDEYGFGKYLRKQHSNFRSIFVFKTLTIGNEDVRCYLALRVFKRGDAEYTRFHNDGTPERERNTITGMADVDWNAIRTKIASALTVSPQGTEGLSELSEAERAFIQRERGITQEIFEIPVYESKAWVETLHNDNFEDSIKVADAVIDQIYGDAKIGFLEIPYGDRGYHVLAFHSDDEITGECWFLLGVGSTEQNLALRNTFGMAEPMVPHLMRKCRRAYPATLFDDKDFWVRMEKDKESNFILSDEEIRIVAQPLKFPLFISGRAGSGKSTVLQYLFAEFLLRYLQNDGVKPPAYISYSANLIENAKKLSTSLLDKTHAYTSKLSHLNKTFKDHVEPVFKKSFWVFQELVRDCINACNPDVLSKRFPVGNRVTYTKYRELWSEKFGNEPRAAKEFGPALSWHVIRTFIKGWDSEAYLEPDDYEKIGRGNKSVTDETFKLVFLTVWEKWYQPLQGQERLWDDQDLVRYCLSPDDDSCETYAHERFAAILCDESQDFTRVETDFFLRMSVFSNRRIYDINTLHQLPFVFAGDEFQTLNPTGFSWDSLRSYFTERLLHATELGKNASAPDPVALTHNYRSTAPIVKFANRIQLLRQTRCGDDSNTVPQIPYFAESHADPVYCLSPDDPQVWEKLGAMGVILIVPSADGQSVKEYIDGTPIKKMVDFYADGSPKNLTIYNPVQAKGLDYPCVAIYGFDNLPELALRSLNDWLATPKEDTEALAIELKYFLSNAYVAATRAKGKLFIISDFSDASFWSFAFSTDNPRLQKEIVEAEKRMLARVGNAEEWAPRDGESMLGFILSGEVDAVTGENIVNAGEVARTTEERGMALHDAGLMRQAAARYREREMQQDVLRCEAFAYRFERKEEEAAERFKEAGLFEEAVSSYWRAISARNVNDLLKAVAKLSPMTQRLEVRLAGHATTTVAVQDVNRDMADVLDAFEGKRGADVEKEVHETHTGWQTALDQLLAKIESPTPADVEAVGVLIEQGARFEKFGIKLDSKRLAQLAFHAGRFERAIELWDKLGEKPREYHQAKLRVLPYPIALPHWELSGAPDWRNRVVEEYRKHIDMRVDEAISHIIGKAVMAGGDAREIREFLPLMLNNAASLEESRHLLKTAEEKGVPVPKGFVEAAFFARWPHLVEWVKPNAVYADNHANDLMSMFNALKAVYEPSFNKEISKAFEERRTISYLEGAFGQFKRSKWNHLLFSSIGAVVERRGFFLDAALYYYEWAVKQSDEPFFKRDMWTRWIVCRERHAEIAKEEDRKLESQKAAAEKRKDLGIQLVEVLPVELKFNRWEWLFSEVLKLSDSVAREVTAKSVETILPESISSPNVGGRENDVSPALPPPDKLFIYDVAGYTFRFNPAKSELSIACLTATDDLRVKIHDGKFPRDSDFVLTDGVLQKRADGTETPFKLFFAETAVWVKIMETGVQFVFPLTNGKASENGNNQ